MGSALKGVGIGNAVKSVGMKRWISALVLRKPRGEVEEVGCGTWEGSG